jgi:hypothetical protein
VSNGRFQDELCDALAPLLPIERCRTDRELLALAAQHVLGGASVGHELLGLDRRVFAALVRNDIPTVLLVLERDIPRRLASLALDGGAARVRILPVGAVPSSTLRASHGDLCQPGARGSVRGRGASTSNAGQGSIESRACVRVVGSGGTGCTTQLVVPLLHADPSLGLDGILKAQAAGVSSLERVLKANLQPRSAGDAGSTGAVAGWAPTARRAASHSLG